MTISPIPVKVSHQPLAGLVILEPRRFRDDRGWFEETWSRRVLHDAGIDTVFVQDNHSASLHTGTMRGLHYQAPPHAQDKLVRCSRGSIYDAVVDVRVASPTFGRWMGIELSAENGLQLYIPRGFLHGFVTLQPHTEVQYKCSAYYAPHSDGAVRWDSLGIDWPLSGEPMLSPKDAAARPFADFESPFVFGVNS